MRIKQQTKKCVDELGEDEFMQNDDELKLPTEVNTTDISVQENLSWVSTGMFE